MTKIYSHSVPTILFVFLWELLRSKVLATLKPEIFGFISASSRTLLAVMFLWIIFTLENLCR